MHDELEDDTDEMAQTTVICGQVCVTPAYMARKLGVSPSTIRRWTDHGVLGDVLPSIPLGGRIYIPVRAASNYTDGAFKHASLR